MAMSIGDQEGVEEFICSWFSLCVDSDCGVEAGLRDCESGKPLFVSLFSARTIDYVILNG